MLRDHSELLVQLLWRQWSTKGWRVFRRNLIFRPRCTLSYLWLDLWLWYASQLLVSWSSQNGESEDQRVDPTMATIFVRFLASEMVKWIMHCFAHICFNRDLSELWIQLGQFSCLINLMFLVSKDASSLHVSVGGFNWQLVQILLIKKKNMVAIGQ